MLQLIPEWYSRFTDDSGEIRLQIAVKIRDYLPRLLRIGLTYVVGNDNKKRTDAVSINLEKTKYSVKTGDSFTIKAETVLANPKKKQLSNAHAAEFRYLSTDKSIAKVSKYGVVTGVSKGTCFIWVYISVSLK